MARINKIMITNVPTLKKEAKVEDAAKLLTQNDCGCVVIVENSKPIGIVTELDIVRFSASKDVNLKRPVSSLMTSPVTLMTPKTKLDEALKLIDTKRFRRYPVVDGDELVGLVTQKDVVNAISDNMQFHRNIQNLVLIVFVLFELFVFVLYKYFPIFSYFGIK